MSWFQNHKHAPEHIVVNAETDQTADSALLKTASVWLTAEDLSDMKYNWYIIIPSQGTGKYINVHRIEYYFEQGSQTYSPGTLYVGGDSVTWGMYDSFSYGWSNWLSQAGGDLYFWDGDAATNINNELNAPVGLWYGQAPDGGDGELGVRVWYTVHSAPMITAQGRQWT